MHSLKKWFSCLVDFRSILMRFDDLFSVYSHSVEDIFPISGIMLES